LDKDSFVLFARSRFKTFASAGISLALFLIVGGPWAVLQTVAWTKMVIDYSAKSSVTEAFSKTFDGNHPCGLCKKITKAKEGEKKSPLVIVPSKKEGPFLAVSTIRLLSPDFRSFAFPRASALTTAEVSFRPDVPVPKT